MVTVEEVMHELGMPRATAYRTVRSLVEAGFLDRISDEGYALGPRIFELYRRLQLDDPLLRVARPSCIILAGLAPPRSVVLLSRYYRNGVICVHQEVSQGPQQAVSYEVGRPMPLYRGSASKAVLAALDRTDQAKLYQKDAEVIRSAELGESRDAFLANLKEIRRVGYCIARGEVDNGRIGISAPLHVTRFDLCGAISMVLSTETATETDITRAVVQVSTAAHEIVQKLASLYAAGVASNGGPLGLAKGTDRR